MKLVYNVNEKPPIKKNLVYAFQQLLAIIAATLLTILPEVLRAFSDYRMLVYAVVLILVMLATNSPFLSVRLQRLKALVRREKTNPGKEGEAA